MTSIVPSSTSTISLIHGTAFTIKKNNQLTRCSLPRKSSKRLISLRRHVVPLLTSVGLFPECRRDCGWLRRAALRTVSATGTDTDVVVEDAGSPVADEDSGGTSDVPEEAVATSEKPPIKSEANRSPPQTKRLRPGRKSEMPPVKNEDLIPGATFTGKVRSIQPFGAFVDFGAFTDGLVHVSRLSNSFVKDVGSVVSVGQEVTVRLVEANFETGRISLTMRENDDPNKLQQQKDAPATARPARRNATKSGQRREDTKPTKFVKGQDLDGTVKNLTRSGAFISLPEGEEGFLPRSEESDGGFESMMGGSSLEIGQEVSVRVLRVARGQVTLTMKKEEEDELDMETVQGVVHAATNPFVLAFRKNKDIASFLDEREKTKKVANQPVKPGTPVEAGQAKKTETVSDMLEVQDQPSSSNVGSEESVSATSKVIETIEEDETNSKVVDAEPSIAGDDKKPESIESSSSQIVEAQETFADAKDPIIVSVDLNSEIIESSSLESVEGAVHTVEKEAEESSVGDGDPSIAGDDQEPESIESSSSQIVEGSVETIEKEEEETSRISNDKGSASGEISSEILSPESPVNEAVIASQLGDAITNDGVQTESSGISSVASSEDEAVGAAILEANDSISGSGKQEDVSPPQEAKDEVIASQLGEPSDISSVAPAEDEAVGAATLEANDSITGSGEQADVPSPHEAKDEEVIASQLVDAITNDGAQTETSGISPVAPVEEGSVGAVDANDSITSGEQAGVPPPQEAKDEEESVQISAPSGSTVVAEISSSESQDNGLVVENQSESTNDEVQPQSSAAEAETPSVVQVENEKAEPASEKVNGFANSNGQSESPSTEKSVKATISPALVKQLREETGAGMMDCKKALSETGGDIVKAQEFLRKKGLASAEKKASRATAEGRIGSYIHDSRIGVLVEVNCETDFVSRGEIFKELVDDIAMQVAACPQVQYLVTEDVPEEIVNKEREIEMQKDDLLSKPEQIRAKIVEGRIRKRLEELALLEQPYIKNDKIMVKDWVKQTIATIGENIKVNRFIRFNLGEGLEKKSQDFAAEVAAQTSAKPVSAPAIEQSTSAETTEPVEKPRAVAVSAALVKQLREETGAGMMDCKKALSETGGDLEKAQEYLRKKGLASADKKSSRLAAEGRIGSYIHDSRIGVLIEVNCETDFVGRSEKFKELVDDLAMQVVACPQVQFVSIEEIPESFVKKEKGIEMQREDLASKPENIREKIVEGRILKRLGELALLEQPFIKDDSILVKDLVKQAIAAIGENIKVRRFVRFTLGESTEDAAEPKPGT